MPRPVFHATMPGLSVGGGPIGIILHVLMLGVVLVFAFLFICIALFLGTFFLLLRALGLGPKLSARLSPFAPFGTAFSSRWPRHGQDFGGTHPEGAVKHEEEEPANQQETVKQLEEFHGSLDEFLKQRKDSDPS